MTDVLCVLGRCAAGQYVQFTGEVYSQPESEETSAENTFSNPPVVKTNQSDRVPFCHKKCVTPIA